MATRGWSVGDLSLITEFLLNELNNVAIPNSPVFKGGGFSGSASGSAPDITRKDGKNILTLYLLHVSRDPYWRNTPTATQGAQLVTAQPLSLNLSYLLTSYAGQSWMVEQQLMSIALAYFHANPIYKTSSAEFTITVEADSIEEMSRLWQAIAEPIRLSAMFRVAVVFLTPEPLTPVQADSRTPVEVNLSVAPDLNTPAPPLGPPVEPVLLGLAAQTAWIVPPPASAESGFGGAQLVDAVAQTVAAPGPPVPVTSVVVPGGSIWVRGTGLNVANASAIFVSGPIVLGVPGTGSEYVATSWISGLGTDSASGLSTAANDLHLVVPECAPLPAPNGALTNGVPPGIYSLTVGNPGSIYRSNPLIVSIGPVVTGVGNGLPVLPADGTGTYTITVDGLVEGSTVVMLDPVALTIGAAVGAGAAVVTLTPNLSPPQPPPPQPPVLPQPMLGTIAWMLPSPLPPELAAGSYVRVRVLVNNVEAPPNWWVLIP
jgi:hypothetical protein